MKGNPSSTTLPKLSSTPSEKHSHSNTNLVNPFGKQQNSTRILDYIPPMQSPNSELSRIEPKTSLQQIDNSQNGNIIDQIEEIQPEESLESLKSKNTHLRHELKSLNEQLDVLLSKKRPHKSDIHGSPGRGSPTPNIGANPEKKLAAELESAKKQLEIYRREWRLCKKRYEEIDDPTKLIKVEQNVIEMESLIAQNTAHNKALAKEMREKNKLIDFLQNAAILNPKESVKGDGVELMRKKYDQAEQKEERLKQQAESKEDYIHNLEMELQKIRQSFTRGLEITGYTEEALKRPSNNTNRRTKAQSVSKVRVPPLTDRGIVKPGAYAWRNPSVEEGRLEFSLNNFNKLQQEIKILEKADAVKEKSRNRDLQTLQGHVMASEEAKTELDSALGERERELETLKQVYQELNTILMMNHVQVPSFERKKLKPTEAAKDDKRVEKSEPVKPVVPKKGDFNDKEILGNRKVKICGIRVWHNMERLSGIQAIYKLPDGSKIEGKKHIEDSYKYKAVKFDMEEGDYLKDLTGFLNKDGDCVECLIFKAKSGQVRKVGKASADAKQFRFDVQKDEIPAIIYGSVTSNKFFLQKNFI